MKKKKSKFGSIYFSKKCYPPSLINKIRFLQDKHYNMTTSTSL